MREREAPGHLPGVLLASALSCSGMIFGKPASAPLRPGFFVCSTQTGGWKSRSGCSMLVVKPLQEGWHRYNRGREHETSRLYQGHRTWGRGRGDDCGAGDRAIEPGAQMAPDGELAEVAGYPLRRRRAAGQ